MGMKNAKRIKELLQTLERQLGREVTPRELASILQGDNSIISKKNKKNG